MPCRSAASRRGRRIRPPATVGRGGAGTLRGTARRPVAGAEAVFSALEGYELQILVLGSGEGLDLIMGFMRQA